MAKQVRVCLLEPAPEPVRFAAAKLTRCLRKMTGSEVRAEKKKAFDPSRRAVWVGACEGFADALGGGRKVIAPRELDDEILVRAVNRALVVTGSNPRSVLIAVYRLLGRLGASWPAPGKACEVLPRVDAHKVFSVRLGEKAATRHRGMCIEGACSIEHVLDLVDWMPKVGLNEWFLQFRTSRFFYDRWYAGDEPCSPKPRRALTIEQSLEFDSRAIEESKKRGMLVHRVGHGWTSSALGLDCLGWYETFPRLAPAKRKLLAQVGGKRALFGNIAINTELCYSNREARKLFNRTVVEYALEHPEVDYLHVWLSDGQNNFCECPACRRKKPAEWYALLLRELADALARTDSRTRIAFLAYANLLEPPRREKLPDDERFVFMFAPISRCYLHHIGDARCRGGGTAGPWRRNKIAPPRTNSEFMRILDGWLDVAPGDGFVFDYHMWLAAHQGLNSWGLARVAHRDVRDYVAAGLNGIMHCGVVRCFWPVPLVTQIIAAGAWNPRGGFHRAASGVLSDACGPSAETVELYLRALDRTMKPAASAPHEPFLLGAGRKELARLRDFLRENSPPVTGAGRRGPFGAMLALHHEFLAQLVEGRLALLDGRGDESARRFERAEGLLMKKGARFHVYVDLTMQRSIVGQLRSL